MDEVSARKAELLLVKQEWEKKFGNFKVEMSELKQEKSDVRRLIDSDIAALKEKEDDIIQSIDEINSYYIDKPKIFEEYVSDIKTKRAIERDLEIIGEAVSRILKKDKDFVLKNAKRIIGARNRIIHGYDAVSDDLIWSLVINDSPNLQDEVRTILNE